MPLRLRPPLAIYAVVAVTFLALLVSAGMRATPGVLMVPLQVAFGWDRATISASAAIGIFLYGLVGFVPGVVCSWLAHEAIDFAPAPAVEASSS